MEKQKDNSDVKIILYKVKCIIILSSKSSGSSALQYYLSKYINVNHIRYTRHYEHETLYWTKVASALGILQKNMLNSEVPIRKIKQEMI